MGEIERVIEKANEWIHAGLKVCMATVIEARGSTPRAAGAKMVISSAGETFGTVGGGSLERRVIQASREVLESGEPAVLEFDLSGKDGGLDSVCGGGAKVFLEAMGEYRKVFVIGAGHIGRALARAASAAGFAVTLVDDREDYLGGGDLPSSVRMVEATPGDFGKNLDIDPGSFVVIATRGHSLDTEWLGAVSGLPLAYVGMVGSRRKIDTVFGTLRDKGVSEDFLRSVHSPVGIDIGAETPEEIAVSITAELIKAWRRRGRE